MLKESDFDRKNKTFTMFWHELDSLEKLYFSDSGFHGTFYLIPDDNRLLDRQNFVIKAYGFYSHYNFDTANFINEIISKEVLVEGVAFPICSIYDNLDLIAIVIPWFRDTMTFKRAILDEDLAFAIRIRAIDDIVRQLKAIHKFGITPRDIHLKNYLIDYSGRGYTVDIDGGCLLRGPHHNAVMNRIETSSCIQSDLINQFTCAISLVLGVDFSQVFLGNPYSSKSVWEIEKNYKNSRLAGIMHEVDNNVNEYFSALCGEYCQRLYFDEINSFWKDEEKVNYVRKKVKKTPS